MGVDVLRMGFLVQAGRNIALLVQVLGSNLRNVHVNQVGVVRVQVNKLIFGEVTHFHVVMRRYVFMRQDVAGLVECVARSLHIPDC